jgi:hypothetical protein
MARVDQRAQAREAAKDEALARGDVDLLGDEFVDDMRRIAGLPERVDLDDREATGDSLRASLIALGYHPDDAERLVVKNVAAIFDEEKATDGDLEAKKFDPDQPRIPAGKPGAGRWFRLLGNLADPVNSRAGTYYGAGADRLFGTSPTTIAPWPQASKRKVGGAFDRDTVLAALRNPGPTGFIDPRLLHSTQPGLSRDGVDYYLGDDYRLTGRTYADHDQAGNRVPLIYVRPGPFGRQALILAGHHRAAAALLRGEPLEALIVEGP